MIKATVPFIPSGWQPVKYPVGKLLIFTNEFTNIAEENIGRFETKWEEKQDSLFQFYVRNPVILVYIQGYSGFIQRYEELQKMVKILFICHGTPVL